MIRSLAALLLLSAASPTPPPAAHPAMWRVSDADTSIYLLGTIHALPAGYRWETPLIRRTEAQAGELVLELPEMADKSAIATLMITMGRQAGLPPLLDRVPAAKRKALAAVVAESGLPMAVLDGMKSWAAGLLLTAVQLRELGLDGANGVEETLTTAFDAAHKPVAGLETAQQQLGFFDTLPEADQRQFLGSVVDDSRDAKGDFADMLASWARGDEAAIAKSFDDELKTTPRLKAVLVTNRNAHWADWIAARMAKPGTLLVAVGAGHLAGSGSVPNLLRAKGLKVERVE